MTSYPKRLIEVDLPIKKISAHARREKSIRHGHISTLHIWWARRPLAACRAVICAALWPDPADEQCPQSFREAAGKILANFAEQARSDATVAGLVKDHWSRWNRTNAAAFQNLGHAAAYADMRHALLDFIADFANWDASTVPAFLETARALTQAAHESLGGLPETRPLVVDPFAGGGAIPLEALRVGADAFASDLNPVAVLLNKVVLEYIPKYGQQLADGVRKWGQWIKEEAEKELAEFYPRDPDGATPIAYLWARTIISEAPDDGTGIPVEVPLIRSLWLAKKKGRNKALRWVRDPSGKVQTETVDVTYANGQTRTVHRPLLEIFEPKKASEVKGETIARGSVTCPITGYTTSVNSVRRQLKERRGGAIDARLLCIVTIKQNQQGRFYRLPNERDVRAARNAFEALKHQENANVTSLSLVPNETISLNEIRRISVPIYGMVSWGDLFSPRQALALVILVQKLKEVPFEESNDLAGAVRTCLALALDRQADINSSLCRWLPLEAIANTFGRQAIPMVWDFAEANPFSSATGSWDGAYTWIMNVINANKETSLHLGQSQKASATSHPLPDQTAAAFITDPPYYDAVPYAYLSDFFYVWLQRSLGSHYPDLFEQTSVPKAEEIVVDRPHELSTSQKDVVFYEQELTKAFSNGQRILQLNGIGLVVFASKTTASWEAILQAMLDSGWIITGSWPIDSERSARVAAQGQARLGSSIHIVCRPRKTSQIGEWRDVLQELPQRISTWLPHLAGEGVVGADAIFACLGPALEIFSRYAYVEKASGKPVMLREYLEHVWAAIAKEALATIFENADATGFEADARLTAIWFWTLKAAANGYSQDKTSSAEDSDEPAKKKVSGYSMEYDAVRKLAQGLGAELDKLSRPGGIVTIKGNLATLNGIASREKYLIGQQLSLFNDRPTKRRGTGRTRTVSATLESVSSRQPSLFAEDEIDIERDPAQPFLPSFQPTLETRPIIDRLSEGGSTTLDRLHQTMLLFGRSQTSLLGPFLTETGMGTNPRFWQLANALSALYPPNSDEKRWVDGVLARKKGLGF